MTNNRYIKEFLGTSAGTEGSLLIPRKIYDTLIPEVAKNLIPRSEAAIYVGPAQIPGSSIDLNRVIPDIMDVRLVAEGAEVPMDQTEYNNLNIKPAKYGVTIRITRELMEDSQFDLLQHNIMIAGKRFAENENSLVVTALDGADTTVSGGAAITIADITTAMFNVEQDDYSPTTFIVGNEVLNDLRNIDTFVEANKVGNTDMLERGFLGTIYGMNVIKVSTTAGMTATSAYVFDNKFSYVIAEKRPISLEQFELPSQDMTSTVITQRLAVSTLRAPAIGKITTS